MFIREACVLLAFLGQEEYKDQGEPSVLKFADTCVGNLGAPLVLPAAFDEEDHVSEMYPQKSADPLTTGLIWQRVALSSSEHVYSSWTPHLVDDEC